MTPSQIERFARRFAAEELRRAADNSGGYVDVAMALRMRADHLETGPALPTILGVPITWDDAARLSRQA